MLIVVLALLLQAEPTVDAEAAHERTRLELEFDRHWQAYLLAEHGCPEIRNGMLLNPLSPAECTKRPQILADELKKARNLAKRIFHLTEPKGTARQ